MIDFEFAVFDMDGTILDSMQYWRNAVGELCSSRHIHATEEDFDTCHRLTVAKAVEYTNAKYGQSFTLDDVCSVMRLHYERDISFKGEAEALLESLKNQGIKMCLITATPTKLVPTAIKTNGLDRFFDNIYSPDHFPKGKADPQTFIDALKKIGGAPHQCALFEDALYSIKTAKQLGMKIYGVEDVTQSRHKEEIMQLSDYYFSALPKQL